MGAEAEGNLLTRDGRLARQAALRESVEPTEKAGRQGKENDLRRQ